MDELRPAQPNDALDDAHLDLAMRHAFVDAAVATPPPSSRASATSTATDSGASTLVTGVRDTPEAPDDLPAGSILQGRYRIDATLARGGIGVLLAALAAGTRGEFVGRLAHDRHGELAVDQPRQRRIVRRRGVDQDALLRFAGAQQLRAALVPQGDVADHPVEEWPKVAVGVTIDVVQGTAHPEALEEHVLDGVLDAAEQGGALPAAP